MNTPIGYEHPEIGEMIDETFLYLDNEGWRSTSIIGEYRVTISAVDRELYCRPIKNKDLYVITANHFRRIDGRVIGVVESKQAGERYIVGCNPGIVFNEIDDIWQDNKTLVWYKITPTKMLD